MKRKKIIPDLWHPYSSFWSRATLHIYVFMLKRRTECSKQVVAVTQPPLPLLGVSLWPPSAVSALISRWLGPSPSGTSVTWSRHRALYCVQCTTRHQTEQLYTQHLGIWDVTLDTALAASKTWPRICPSGIYLIKFLIEGTFYYKLILSSFEDMNIAVTGKIKARQK